MSEVMNFDVIIIGAGPSGLAASIRLKQSNPNINICILEKGAEVGSHIISGAVFETEALDELIPDWKEKDAPLNTKATKDEFIFLTKKNKFRLPTPRYLKNHGNYIISLSNLCKWLADQAIGLGVEIFPGFPADDYIVENGKVVGVKTGSFGIDKNGNKKNNYQESMEIRAKYTILSEGCRGSLSERIMDEFNLRKNSDPQTYAIGLKETWQIDPKNHEIGKITHSIGWPLKNDTYGGSFIYHTENNQISVGYVIGLDYKNPYLNPYEEFQRFKTHPKIKYLFDNAKRISYGARAINEGGYQSLPKLIFPGGALIGCSAGMVNVPKIKGSHNAIRSGIMVADAINNDFENKDYLLKSYPEIFKKSKVNKELLEVRNIRPGFTKSLFIGLINAAFDSILLRGKAPWTLRHKIKDHVSTKLAKNYKKINYPKHDNKLTFDILNSVQLTGTNHEEDQPCHLNIKDSKLQEKSYSNYDGIEARFCPASVYEYVNEGKEKRLQINAQNCIHCKTCDIKTPSNNIRWKTPEGSGGPRYSNM